MVLSKHELISALGHEVRLLLHLAGKAGPESLSYRPSPNQRSLLELLQYLTIMAPIHLRAVMAPKFDMDAWRIAWNTGKAAASQMNFDQATDAIAQHPALFAEQLESCPDSRLREQIEMFGHKASRGSLLVSLVLNHYAAYRMQLFLYLKAAGRPELSTINLWAGIDAPTNK